MQTIRIAPPDVIQAPPAGQGSAPGKNIDTNPGAIKGAVSESEAIKTVEGTRISTLTPMDGQPLTPMTAPGSSVPLGGLIDATLAVELMDALLPAILVVVCAYIGMKMKKPDLQLTAKEKTTIAPLVQRCLDSLMINFQSPWAALGVSLVVIYGAKIGEHGFVQVLDKKAESQAKKKEEAKIVEMKKDAAPPVTMTQAAPANVPNMPQPGLSEWEPTDEMIYEGMKRYKKDKHTVAERLKREYKAGTLQAFLKKKPYKQYGK